MAKRRQELIAESLSRVSGAAKRHVLRSRDMSRTDRERLGQAKYLQPVMKGWYLLTTPDAESGESTSWFASYWSFLSYYLADRFGDGYCLGAGPSLALHLGSTTIPRQVAVITARGGRSVVELPHGTSLVTYEDPANLPEAEDVVSLGEDAIRGMSLPLALARVSPSYFRSSPGDADIALRMVETGADLARVLVRGGHAAAADRLIGAYRAVGDLGKAAEIEAEMRAAGFHVSPADPFDGSYQSPLGEHRVRSPYGARIRSLWKGFRDVVVEVFPAEPGLPGKAEAYLRDVEDNYRNDAYNSLSIEGYRVTPELIEQLRGGGPVAGEGRSDQAVMAVQGYNRAFNQVQEGIAKILDGEDAGLTIAEHLHGWYRALFSPSVDAGLLQEHDLIGYRRQPVYIKGSQHVPPPWSALPDCMATFFDLMQHEERASVRAVLGHYFFVFIHPYPDGNGRLARFVMNAMLASGGYPWTIIPMESRSVYMQALEAASVESDIAPFARYLAGLVRGLGPQKTQAEGTGR